MKKKLILLCLALVIVLAVLLLPLPKKMKVSLQGMRVINGEVDETVTISIEGWYLNYAIRQSKFAGTLKIEPFSGETEGYAEYQISQEIFSLSNSKKYISMLRYSASENESVPADLYFSDDMNKIMVSDEADKEACYIAASEGDESDIEEIIGFFLESE